MLRQLLRRRRPGRSRRVSLHAEWLEPRLLFSADAAALLLAGAGTDAAESRVLDTAFEYKAADTAATPGEAELRAAYALTRLQFEANAGQLGAGVDFAAFGSGYGIQLSGGAAEILLAGAEAPVRLELVGARPGEASAEDLLPGRSNYLIGREAGDWVTDIANYGSVLYRGVHDGIDVRYYGNQGQLEYDFLLAAGADASLLQLRFEGVGHMEVTAEGDLLLRVAGTGRDMRFAAPVSYQEGPGGREAVASRYELQADGTVRIAVGAYDRTRALVVDPVLRYASYFGEGSTEQATAVAIGADGTVYVAGHTSSVTGPLSGRIGADAGGLDMFVARFSADLGTLLYATRIGGSLDDQAQAIAVDASGNAVVVGTVSSANFPTAGASVDQAALSGTRDAVVLTLNAAGNALVFSTYFGGSGNNDAGAAVALDAAGRIHVAGTIAVGNNENAFLNVYDASGVRLAAHQFGGSGSDGASGVALDAAGNTYLVGTIGSTVAMVNGHQVGRGGGPDGFLVRYNASGAIDWSTYIGNSNGDSAAAVAVDGSGRAYVVGRTDSPATSGFTSTSGALSTLGDRNHTGWFRIYDTTLTGAASLAYSSFIGGSGGNDVPTSIALIGGSRAVIVGHTGSTDLPTTTDAVRQTSSGTSGFALVVDTGLTGASQLAYGSYFASGATMGGAAVAGNTFYFVGSTAEAGLATSGAYDTAPSGTDGFIAAIGGFAYNTAPTLAGTFNLPSIAEDSGAGAGALVASLLVASDPDADAQAGIAIVGADSGNGSWQYTLDGSTWTTFTTPAPGSALLLAADASTRVRFVPAANFAGTSSLTFHAWDRTSGTAGTVRALGITGGASAFSSSTGSSWVTVTPVNDRPAAAAASASGTEDAAAIAITLTGSDVEDGSVAGIQVLTLPGGGLLYSDAGLQTQVSAGALYGGGSATLYFVPAANFNGTASFTFAAIDSAAEVSPTATATITVAPVNDAPVATPASVTGLEDGGAIALTLTGSDVEEGAVTAVRLLTLPAGGQLYTDATLQTLAVAGSWYGGGSLALWYVPAPDANGTASFGFTVRDATGLESAAGTATIDVAAVNDAPVQTAGTMVSVTAAEGQVVSLGLGGLDYITGPANESGQTIVVTVTALPGSVGTIQLVDGTAVVLGNSYTLAQLQGMRLAAGQYGSATFGFRVGDSGGTANGGQDALPAQSVSLTVTNVAPVLTGSQPFTQLEDAPGAGTLVSDIIAGTVADGGGPYGIAVTAVPNGNIDGVWQYSIDGGASWLTLTGASNNARLLGPDARVRFLTDAGENINGAVPGFSFRAWDGSSGVAGGLANTNVNGGTTAFSTGTATAQLTITPVNDVPVRFDVGAMTFLAAPSDVSVDEASGLSSLGLGYLEYIPGYSEEEYYSQALTYTVTGVPGAAVGTVYLADGVTAVSAGTSYTLAQIQGMRFRPGAGVQNASGTFSWQVRDDAGTANGGVDTLLESITITVRNVAPTLSGANVIPAIVEDAPGNGIRVADLISGRASDPSNSLGIAVTAAGVTAAGSWQYSSDGGSTWNSLGAASDSSAILLSSGGQWRVRFNPAANWNGTPPGFTFRAWDRSTGSAGGSADTTVNGGSTAFSSASVTASLWVGAVNDAPARTDVVGVPLSPLILLDGSPITSLGLAGVTFGPGGGTDEAGQSIVSYTVTSLPTGLGTTYLADGTTPVVLGNPYTLAQIQGMQFLSSGVGALGTQAFSFAVRDNGGTANGGTDTATFTVSVIVNRAPVLHGANSPLTVFEDFDWTNNAPPGNPPPWSSPAQRAGMLVSDIVAGQIFDSTGSPGGIAIIGMSGSGSWQFSTDGGSTWTTLTSASNSGALQLAADALTRLRFLPSADWNSSIGTASITVRAWDQTVGSNGTYGDATWNGGPFAYSAVSAVSVVTLTPRNDAPIAVGATGGTVEEGAAPVAMLAAGSYAPGPATATDEAAQTLAFRFTAISDRVEVLLADGVTLVTVGTSYTQAQFQGMLFRSAPDATPGSALVTFVVQDSGGTDNRGVDSSTHSLTLTVTNRAPVLNGANPLAPILEDTPGTGTLVSDLVAGQVADPTGTRGIAVTAVDNGNGSWQYSRDGGTTWTAFGAPGAGSARLLLADALTRIRFVPAADWNGAATLTFAAWDGTSGSAGGVADASAGGSGTPFSTATATTSITVQAVNDAPVGGGVSSLVVVEDSGSTSLGLGGVSYGPGGGADESGQALTFTVAALPPASFGRITLSDGTDVVAGDYTIEQLRGMRFVTAAHAVGAGSFSFHVRDDGGGTDTLVQTVTLTITPVNDAPVAVGDVVAGTEDTPLAIAPSTLTANDADIDTANAALTITSVTSGTGGTVALVDGTIVFTPAPDFNGTAIFAYSVSDGSGGTSTGIVRVVLAPANDAPVAGGDVLTATAGVTLVIPGASLLANDTDVDGDTLGITAVGNAVNGTVALVGGDVVFVPTPLFVGAASFSYTVSDGRGGSATAVVNLDVVLGNSAPVAGADATTTAEDTPMDIATAILLLNDSDPDGGTPVVTGVTAVTGGTVSLSGGTITFVPTPDFDGTARFTYTIDDGNGGGATGTVDVVVTPVNDAPVASADTAEATEDQPLTILAAALAANDTDVDGDALTVTSVTAGTGGAVALVDGNIVFTPAADFHGVASFSYTVEDAAGLAATGTVAVTVAEVNDAPVAAADAVAGAEDTPLVIAPATLLLNDVDVDGDPLVIDSVGGATGGSVALVGGNIVFTPALDLNGPGSGSFTYTVSDGRGGTSTASVSVDLAAVNDAPVALDDTATVAEDTVLTLTPAILLANDSDPENHAFTLVAVNSATGGTAAIVGGNVVFTPAADFHGDASFGYTIEDALGARHAGTVTVTVTPVNDAPAALDDAVAGTEDTPLVILPATLLANDVDVDGDTLAIVAVGDAAGGTVGISGGNIVFTPDAHLNGAGAGSFSYTVSDGQGGTATRTVTVDLAAVNDAPLAHGDVAQTSEDTQLTLAVGTLTANDEDVDGHTLTVTGVSDAVGGSVTLAGSEIVFTPSADFAGTGSFRYTVSDGFGGTSSASVTVNVLPVNDAPEAADDVGGSTAEDTPLTIAPATLLANDSDREGDALAIVAVADGPGGQVNLVGGNVVFTPDADFFGTAGFYYSVSDGNGGLATAYATVEVTPVNDLPLAGADHLAGTEDTAVVVAVTDLLVNDSDVEGSALTVTGVTAVSGGTVSLAGGVVTFTPTANFHGQAVFTYQVEDGEGAASGTVTIDFAAVDDATVTSADVASAAEDETVIGNVLANDSDVDSALAVASFTVAGDAATYLAGATATIAGQGSLRIGADGGFTFTPAPHWNGGAPLVTYTTATGVTGTLAITIVAVDDPTVAQADVVAVDEDFSAGGNVLTNDSDVDDVLQVASFSVGGTSYAAGTVVGIAGTGSFTLGADGAYSFVPAADWNGTLPTVTYTTSTGASSTLTVTVTAVDDPTVMTPEVVVTPEDTAVAGNVLTNDIDVDDVLQVASFTVGGTSYAAGTVVALASGSFALGADGSVSFAPTVNWNGALPQVTYTTNTGASSTLAITVTAVDDPTVMNPEVVTTPEDTSVAGNVLANDSDVDDALQVASFSVGGTSYAAGTVVALASGSFALGADGSFSFTPAANWNGMVPQVTYTTNTGASSTLAITVAAVDDPTVMNPEVATATEDTAVVGNVLANDSDVDDALQVASFSVGGSSYAAGTAVAIAGGSFTLGADGAYSFTPAADWNGTAPLVTYTTSTGVSSTLAITVTAVDDATVMDPDVATTDEDMVVAGNVLANDSDVDDVLQVASFTVGGSTYAAGTAVALASGSFTLAADGSFSFAPTTNWNGTAPLVTYTTSTGASSTLAITVTAVDDATVMNPDDATTDEDMVAAGNVLANDSDVDDALRVASFSIGGTSYAAGTVVALASGSFTLAADGAFSFAPTTNWNGTVPLVTYTTSTGASSTLAVTVTAVDDPTVMTPEVVVTPEDTAVAGNVLANDSDVDDVLQVAGFSVGGTSYAAGTVVGIAGTGNFTLDADGAYRFTPAADWNGTLPLVTYTTGTGASATLAIVVTPVDDATVTRPDSVTVAEDSTVTGNVLANDSDVDDALQVSSFTFGGATHAAGSTVAREGIGSFTLAADGTYSYTPSADWNGAVPLVLYTLGTGASATLAIDVAAIDDAPVRTSAPPADLTVAEGSAATPLGLADLAWSPGGGADEAAQALAFTVTRLPDGLGRIVLADGVTVVATGASYTLDQVRGMHFLPGRVSSGSAEFAFTVSDGSGTVPGERITLTVLNRAPELAGANALPQLAEDSLDAGMLVGELLAGHASDPSGRLGLAVISAQSDGGRWQFSRDGGRSWEDFTAVAADDAQLLADDGLTRVRFVPNADWNGTAGGLAFRAWDQTTLPGLTRADTRDNGGSTAFSTAVADASVTVLPVNDAPAPVATGGPMLYVPAAGGPVRLDGWNYGPGGGADEAGQSITVTLTGLPAGWTAVRGEGRTPVGAGDALTLQEFLDLRFIPAADAAGEVRIAWLVRDDGGTSAGGVNETPGGATILVEAPPAPEQAPGPRIAPPEPVPGGPATAPPPVAPAPAPVAAPAPRPAAGPVAALGDALMATPVSASLMEILSGFAAQALQVPQEHGDRLAALAGLDQRVGLHLGTAADFIVTGFARDEGAAGRITAEDFQQALRSGAFVEELNRLRRELQEEFDLDRSTSITVAGLSLGVSVVYVLWLIRGGVLLGSYLSALPAWRLLDPLPVLARASDREGTPEDEDDEAFDPARPGGGDPLRGIP